MPYALLAMEGADAGLTAMSSAASALLDLVGTIYTTAIEHPLLMIPIAATCLGTAVGLFRALTGQRRRGRK